MKNIFKKLFVKENGNVTVLFLVLVALAFLALIAFGAAINLGYIENPLSLTTMLQILVVLGAGGKILDLIQTEKMRSWLAGTELRFREGRQGT